LVALSTPVFQQVEKFSVGQIHGRPTRSKICVGHGPHSPYGSGAYGNAPSGDPILTKLVHNNGQYICRKTSVFIRKCNAPGAQQA